MYSPLRHRSSGASKRDPDGSEKPGDASSMGESGVPGVSCDEAVEIAIESSEANEEDLLGTTKPLTTVQPVSSTVVEGRRESRREVGRCLASQMMFSKVILRRAGNARGVRSRIAMFRCCGKITEVYEVYEEEGTKCCVLNRR